MSNNTELKTVVSEKVHDDFLVLSRLMGFASKSEYLRYLVEEKLYGHLSNLNNTPVGVNSEWQSKG